MEAVTQIRYLILVVTFTLLGSCFHPSLSQDSPESKVSRIYNYIDSLPNMPKISPVRIYIDRAEYNEMCDYGCYLARPPEIHLPQKFIRSNSDVAILVTLAHELGHHFAEENAPEFAPSQYFADAFALYILGESQYKKGCRDLGIAYLIKKREIFLELKTDRLLYKHKFDQVEREINSRLVAARSRLSDVIKLVQAQKIKLVIEAKLIADRE